MSLEFPGLDRYCALDAAGFLPGAGETPAEFLARVEAILDAHREFETELAEKGELVVFDGIRVRTSDRIPAEIIAEAEEVTGRLYDFRVRHVPGFFLSRDVGLLWGGCLIADTELPLSIFLIRGAFRTRERWLFYNRRELLAHELCHSMRQSLHEITLEEHFAYQTSPSRLRRYLGNCFIRERDAICFIVPALLLLCAQFAQTFWLPRLPVWPFWPVALAYPAFLLLRNMVSRQLVTRAARKLIQFGVARPGPVLFRCTREELRQLGAFAVREDFENFVDRRAGEELRWAIIRRRFMQSEPGGNTDETCRPDPIPGQ